MVPSKKSFFDEKVETRNWLRIGEIGGKWGKENQDEREREDKRGGWRVRVCVCANERGERESKNSVKQSEWIKKFKGLDKKVTTRTLKPFETNSAKLARLQ